jgi:hypothetical protein
MSSWERRLLWGLFIVLLVAFVVIEAETRTGFERIPEHERVHIVPNKKLAPMLSMSFAGVWSEFILLEAQIFVTEHRGFGTLETGKLLKSMGELINVLDPQYQEAIIFLAVSLTEYWGYMGVSDGNDLLRLGLLHNPDNYNYSRLLGFNYYLYGTNYPDNRREAIKWFRTCLSYEDCPKQTIWMIENLMKEEPSAIAMHASMICSMCETAEEDSQRKNLCLRCRYYTLLEQLDHVRRQFEKQQGQPLRSINELVRAGYLEDIPEDPMGGQWVVTPKGNLASSEMLDDNLSTDGI